MEQLADQRLYRLDQFDIQDGCHGGHVDPGERSLAHWASIIYTYPWKDLLLIQSITPMLNERDIPPRWNKNLIYLIHVQSNNPHQKLSTSHWQIPKLRSILDKVDLHSVYTNKRMFPTKTAEIVSNEMGTLKESSNISDATRPSLFNVYYNTHEQCLVNSLKSNSLQWNKKKKINQRAENVIEMAHIMCMQMLPKPVRSTSVPWI